MILSSTETQLIRLVGPQMNQSMLVPGNHLTRRNVMKHLRAWMFLIQWVTRYMGLLHDHYMTSMVVYVYLYLVCSAAINHLYPLPNRNLRKGLTILPRCAQWSSVYPYAWYHWWTQSDSGLSPCKAWMWLKQVEHHHFVLGMSKIWFLPMINNYWFTNNEASMIEMQDLAACLSRIACCGECPRWCQV